MNKKTDDFLDVALGVYLCGIAIVGVAALIVVSSVGIISCFR